MSSIAVFLDDKVLFVTGATGFVAKGLVEKVLRTAPGVKRIYILVRPQKRSSVGTAAVAAMQLSR